MQRLLRWLDPHGYHRTVPILQSSPEALLVMTQHKRAAHAPMRRHANDVSPLVAAVLGAPQSVGARRIMFQSSRCAPLPCLT